MEEVVGFLFNLQVNPQQQQQPELKVGLVTEDDGKPVDVLARASAVKPEPTAEDVSEPEPEPEAEAEEQRPPVLAKGLERKADRNLSYSAPDESGEATKTNTGQVTAAPKTGRNQLCPCGSGKKYKVCHGRPGA